MQETFQVALWENEGLFLTYFHQSHLLCDIIFAQNGNIESEA